MKLSEIKESISSVFVSANETMGYKKVLKIKDIVLIPEFEKLLAMEESVLGNMNQVFNQIVEKRKEEKGEVKSKSASSPSTSSDSVPLPKDKTNVSKPRGKKASAKKSEKTYEDGIRFAISQIKNGVTLEELEKSLPA